MLCSKDPLNKVEFELNDIKRKHYVANLSKFSVSSKDTSPFCWFLTATLSRTLHCLSLEPRTISSSLDISLDFTEAPRTLTETIKAKDLYNKSSQILFV